MDYRIYLNGINIFRENTSGRERVFNDEIFLVNNVVLFEFVRSDN